MGSGAPNELFCKKAVLQWVFCWENWSSFMSCWQDKIHLLGDFLENFLLSGHYRLRSGENFFKNFGQSLKICWNYGCSWWNAHNSFMLCSLLGKILVPSSWECRTPFNLPGKAVMRRQASFLSPGKFQGHCKMFLKVLRCVLPWDQFQIYVSEHLH